MVSRDFKLDAKTTEQGRNKYQSRDKGKLKIVGTKERFYRL